jgi:hypothetical protein
LEILRRFVAFSSSAAANEQRFKRLKPSNLEASTSFFLIKKKQKIKAAEKLAKMSAIALQRKS